MKWTGNPWSATRVASSVYSICFSTALSCASWRSDRENFWGSWTLRRRERSSDPVTAEVSGSTGATVKEISDISDTLRNWESINCWKSLLRTRGRADSWMITSSLVQGGIIAATDECGETARDIRARGVEIA